MDEGMYVGFGTKNAVVRKIVAVMGAVGDWAAYEGPASWPDARVAFEGDKISREAAEALFPDIAARREYRR